MKISIKIAVLVVLALVMSFLTFGVTLYFNQQVQNKFQILSQLEDFKIAVLNAIINEKDYLKQRDLKIGQQVFKYCDSSLQIISRVQSDTTGLTEKLTGISSLLKEYKQDFSKILENEQAILEHQREFNEIFKNLKKISKKTSDVIESTVAMAYIEEGEVRSEYNTLMTANKSIIALTSELYLSLNEDLLLNNNEKVFLKTYEQTINTLQKEAKNIAFLVKTLKEPIYEEYSRHVSEFIPDAKKILNHIYKHWQENVQLVSQLNNVRTKILKSSDKLLNQLVSDLQRARKNSLTMNMVLVGLTLVILIVVAVFLGRSITGPINSVAHRMRDGADEIEMAVEQVAESSQTLAEGASRQAASLEEISSSLEEMSSMTQQNAENASQANAMMMETTQVVGRADKSMDELTRAMNMISEASEETSKIIKTIDEIAFQTNLLALNAAVEAARAGEAGAGFAVVADEVRSLAMRAAEAAKNTADLIESTLVKVREGSALAEETGKAFSDVTQMSEKVASLIAEISTASREQAEGVSQISKAIQEIGDVVQTTAANSEESASASQAMKEHVKQIKQLVTELLSLVYGKHEVYRLDREVTAGTKKPATVALRGTSNKVKQATLPARAREKGKKEDAVEASPEEIIPLDDEEGFKDF